MQNLIILAVLAVALAVVAELACTLPRGGMGDDKRDR